MSPPLSRFNSFSEYDLDWCRRDEFAHAYEYLLRSLLILPNNPAVINLQTMGLHSSQITTGGDLEVAIAMYYDTPVIKYVHFSQHEFR